MVARLGECAGFDRRRCRQRALERWTTARMVRDHERLYRRVQPMVQQLVGDVRSAKIGA
jgi:hypothetical protein